MLMDSDQILACLPHRYPFLLVDRVLEVVPGQSLVAIKNVTANEQFFTGHFPQQMIMPGVLILESLSQAAIILASRSVPKEETENGLWLFAGLDNVRFKRKVIPGDQLRLSVEVLRLRRDVCKFKGIATVDGEFACSSEMLSVKGKINSD